LSDKHMNVDPETRHISPTPYGRGGTVSPTPRLPGYIPGMPRPMTPRDPTFDSDDARAHSATPRAMAPTLPNANGASLITTTFTSSLLRRGSDASRSTPRPISPSVAPPASSFLSRSAGGQYSSDSQRESASSTDQEASVSSTSFRRRPVSPLTGAAFRPMIVSRPGTPSNITWNINSPPSTPSHVNRTHSRRGSASGHSRNGSLSTDSEFQSNVDRSKFTNRPVRLPAPSDSPGFTQGANTGAWNRSTSPAQVDHRSPSSLSGILDFGSSISVSSRTMRSPTPTQSRSAAASPAFTSNESPDFSKPTVRSPKHHSKSSSHFSLGPSQPVGFSALANSSRSSLESTGSSYHSWSAGQKKDITLELFSDAEQQLKWHDLDKLGAATPGSLQDDDDDFEDIIRRYAGLTKSDFVAIQDKLVSAVRAKENNTEPRERANSLRRRRPSTSQSNYSTNGRDNRVRTFSNTILLLTCTHLRAVVGCKPAAESTCPGPGVHHWTAFTST
jgi:serine/arginine repetitive matrix protein 2